MFRQILGIILLILGVLLLLSYMYNWKIELWPYSILVLGIFFFIMAGKTNPDLYIPATMLILSSLFFIYNILSLYIHLFILGLLYTFLYKLYENV